MMIRWNRRAMISVLLLTALCSSALTCVLMKGWADSTSARTMSVQAASAQYAGQADARDALEQFRTERGELRQQQKAQLNEIIYNSTSDADTIRQAQARLMELMSREEAEGTLEGVLRARGFEDALVTLSGRSANVLIRRDSLTRAETAVILELVLRETGITSGNVKIIPII